MDTVDTLSPATSDVVFDRTTDASLGILTLISGSTGAKEFWALVSLYPSRYEEYTHKIAQGEPIDVFAFGHVIEAGYGTRPSQEKMDDFTRRFGADYSILNMLAETSHV